MTRSVGSLLMGTLVLAVVAGMLGLPHAPGPARATSEEEKGKATQTVAPAAKLKVRLAAFEGKPEELLDPAGKGWELAQPTRVLLNRTPRVYQTEKIAPSRPATLEVRALRSGKDAFFRLTWEDATRNAPEAPPRRKGEADDPAPLYKRPTAATASFADAAAVMVPESPGGGESPSLVMGDAHSPVRLYYWNASHGTQQLKAAGRTRVEGTGKAFRHQARHDADRWAVTMEVAGVTTPTPVAFAVWDGEVADRDGLKMFSIWYILE